jgi:methylglyoxal/glyoxal reductase
VNSLQDTTTLHNGVKMPWFGLGVYKVQEGEEALQSVKAAIKAGYRSIDTAALYQNKEGVGQAIKESGVPHFPFLWQSIPYNIKSTYYLIT